MKKTSPLKHILKTSLPAVIDLASQTLMWTVEAIYIGKLSGAALAGHAMAIQVLLVFFAVLLTFVVGSSLIINRQLGANDSWKANHIFGQAMMLGIFMALVFAIIWHSGAIHIFKLIKENGNTLAQEAGVTYLRTVSYFAPLLITNFIAVGIIRATGDTHYSMIVNFIVNGINFVLAPLLIFGLFNFPRLEVQGAALAAGISHSVGFFVTMFLLRTKRLKIFLSLKELFTPNWASFKQLFKSGLPTTVEQLTWATGQLVLTSFVAGIGVIPLTTHAVFIRIQAVFSMVYMGFGITAMSTMGQNLGAANNDLAEKMAHTAHRVMAVFIAVIVFIMLFFSKQIIHIFTTDPATVALGQKVMYVFAFAQIPKALGNVLAGNLRGIGELKWLMWTTILFVLVFEVGFNYIAAFIFGWGLIGLWAIQTTDETIRLGLNYWRFSGGNWRVKNRK